MPSPTNQRNIRSTCICSINCRVVPKAKRRRDAHRKQDLNETGAQQALGRDQRSPLGRTKLVEVAIEADESIEGDLQEIAQRTSGWDALLKVTSL